VGLIWLYPDEILTKAFPAISTLTVYLWVFPYLLICAGALVLAVREGRLKPTLVVTAMLGSATMLWLYVNGLVNPPEAPADAMSFVCVIAVGAVFGIFTARDRRRVAPLAQGSPRGGPAPNAPLRSSPIRSGLAPAGVAATAAANEEG
jgi:amino acid transporter